MPTRRDGWAQVVFYIPDDAVPAVEELRDWLRRNGASLSEALRCCLTVMLRRAGYPVDALLRGDDCALVDHVLDEVSEVKHSGVVYRGRIRLEA